ncbi:MAG: hypothetical protein ACLR23_19730 [Clostridia bacterium]
MVVAAGGYGEVSSHFAAGTMARVTAIPNEGLGVRIDSTRRYNHQKVDPPPVGSGYQIWTLEDGAFLFNGMFGRVWHVEQDMVIVLTSGLRIFCRRKRIYIQRFMQGVAFLQSALIQGEGHG